VRRLSTLVAVLVVLLLSGAGVALAEPPSRLADRVTDRAGVLTPAAKAEVTAAVNRLKQEKGIDLFVVYVSSFDAAQPEDWANDTARLSQLGRQDVLLAVATDDRAYHVSYDQDFSLSQSVTDSIAANDVEPRLSAGDWAGAAVGLADGIRGGGGSGSGGVGTGVLVLGGVVIVGGGAYLLRRRRKDREKAAVPAPADATVPAPDEFSGVSTGDLSYQGSQALIDVDDAVRTSEQELAAARAHFGDEAVAGFAAALEQSRAEMLHGFTLRQQLDDDIPEDEPTKRAMLAEIIRSCTAADQRLDAQAAAFDQLRNLEATAPEYLAGLATRLDAANARVPQVDAAGAALRTRYAAAALEPVAGNLDQARKLLTVAADEVQAARDELAEAVPTPEEPNAGRSAAVMSGRAAEDAITQAGTLLDGIGRLEGELVAATEKIAAARAETEQDLAEARTLLSSGDAGGLAALIARAEAALVSAAEAERATPPDPLAALRLVDEADKALDRGLAEARDAQARNTRARAALEQTLLTARSAVSAADDFIATRRGAVGTEARTRLAEAQRHLAQAQAGGDPTIALGEAQAADGLARQALQVAQNDVSRWSGPTSGGHGGRGGSSLGVDLGSLVLGGILSGGLSGGRSGDYGGGGFSGGFGGGGRSPGSFGGSGTRGRRGGGGRF
jgi:LPXTG-motif cell wall-anchored protein